MRLSRMRTGGRRAVVITAALYLSAGGSVFAASATSGNARVDLLESGPVSLAAPYQIRASGDANFYTDGPNFSADWLYKYTWYYRTTRNNEALSWPSNPVRGGDGTGTLGLVYDDAGYDFLGVARFDSDVFTDIIDSATPGRAAMITRVNFASSAANTATQTFRLFAYLDPTVVGTGTERIDAVRQTNNDVGATVSKPGNSNFIKVHASGNPTFAQAGDDRTTIGGTPLHAITGGNLTTSSANTNLQNQLTFNSASPYGAAIGFQWNLTLAPGETASEIRLGFATNGELPAAGDANYDLTVDFQDLLILAQQFEQPTTIGWNRGDFTFDGVVNFEDLLLLSQNYVGGNFSADWSAAQAMVPEPVAAVLIWAVPVVLARKSRVRR